MLDLDPAIFGAVEQASADRWGHVEELLAQQTELLYQLLRAFVSANTDKAKRRTWPEYHYPRPGEKRGPAKVSWGQLAAHMIGR